jgi:cytochrome P450
MDISYENLKKLDYIDWIINETFRLGTPIPTIFARKSVKDHFLGNIPVTKGTYVWVSTYPNQLN